MPRRNTSRRMSMPGARRIPANATCTTTSLTVGTLSPARPVSAFRQSDQRCERNLPSLPGPARPISSFQPAPETTALAYVGYKVTNPSPGVWHYEYAVYNQNLDRGIQSFSVPLGPGITISNIGFHAPPQHPGWANDGTVGKCRIQQRALDCHADRQFDDLEFGNLCPKSERECDPLGHVV